MFDGNNSTRGGVISVILFISSSDTIEEDLPPGGGGQIKKVHMMKNVVGHKCVCLQQTRIQYLKKHSQILQKTIFSG